MSEEIKDTQVSEQAVAAVAEPAAPEKKKVVNEVFLEILIAIFLAVTAVATAWATWIGSLHGGNQATNYTKSNNLAAEGNSDWNEASQSLVQDMMLWNDINSYMLSIFYSQAYDDEENAQLAAYQLFYLCKDNLSERMAAAINWDVDAAEEASENAEGIDFATQWAVANDSLSSPFFNTEFVSAYYDDARAILAESDALLKEGQKDNANGDAFNLVTVFYSLVLFLLGICGTLKKIPNRFIVVIVAIVCFIAATIYMFTIPMPTGFNFASFFTR